MEMARSLIDVDVGQAGTWGGPVMPLTSYPAGINLDRDIEMDAETTGPNGVGVEAPNEVDQAPEDATTTGPNGVGGEASNESDQASEDTTTTGPNEVGEEASNESD
ncbi:hypothetical protein PV10_07571 [Exophiala mesophila]|uniref:Uncharacterized protein n=1 Tax=Exophiala mesophila TaxID=212818 RepID=A0A0D1ZTV6_EXOME|nr:uncharacterized protein PV10_07571 [Exophiala mesophila]KIV90243.1 hypothetical protein PV10_07571 [Exophiala mesophila]